MSSFTSFSVVPARAEAGKIRCISAPTLGRLLIDDEIFHFNPAWLRILFNVPGGMSTEG
jgi:hypothetical protein